MIYNQTYMNPDGDIVLNMLDAEGDVIICKFYYYDCVTVDTKDLTYIMLDSEMLYTMIEDMYMKYFELEEIIRERTGINFDKNDKDRATLVNGFLNNHSIDDICIELVV